MKTMYIGVFLTPESKALLLSHFSPIHPRVYADHMTMIFKPSDLELENIVMGQKVKLRVEAEVSDELGQCVWVSGVLSKNRMAHITVSVNHAKGGTPNYSNELLKTGLLIDSEPLILDGIIDTHPRTGESKNG